MLRRALGGGYAFVAFMTGGKLFPYMDCANSMLRSYVHGFFVRFVVYPKNIIFVARMKPEPARHGTPMANQV